MTGFGWFTLFLFLHVGAAIIAFGPTFVFPLVGALASKEPMHGNFGARLNVAILDRLVLPFALSMPVTGIFLIYLADIDLIDRSGWWLDIAIAFYVLAIGVAFFLQRPQLKKLVHLTTRPPSPDDRPSLGSSGAVAGEPPPGPLPGLVETTRQIQRNGAIMGVSLIVIVLLMVVKPQF
jgi:hypothetical protein